MLQADGIRYSSPCLLHWRDAMMMQQSSMLATLRFFYQHGPLCPVACVTDKAYGCTLHLFSLHTSLEFRMMNWINWASAMKEDSRNKGPKISMELSFYNTARLLMHTDNFASHCILQRGKYNWPYSCYSRDLKILFHNLLTCAESHGNWLMASLESHHPLVVEYWFSANHNLVVPLPRSLMRTKTLA